MPKTFVLRSVLLAAGVLAASAAGWPRPAGAELRYLMPPGAGEAQAPDGGVAKAWPSLGAALVGLSPGDEVRLMPGDYGDLVIDGEGPSSVLIRPEAPETVHATSLQVRRGDRLTIEGLSIWPDRPNGRPLIETREQAHTIVLRDLDVRSREDAAAYPGWSQSDWEAARQNGALIKGPDNALLDSRFIGLYFAISATGARDRVAGNLVAGFSGDGLRGLGDGSVFEGNRVQDCVHIDDNHADGFQSWSLGDGGAVGRGTVDGLVLRNNVLIEWARPPVSPLRCDLQGIGLFDGMFSNLAIENNLIVVSAYHGIAVAGGVGVHIVNNTLINPYQPGSDRPWLSVVPHKDGTASAQVVVANNLAPRFRLVEIDPSGLIESHNLVAPYPARDLVAPYQGSYEPALGSPPVDAGDPRYATATDIAGHRRDDRPDIGAFEHE